MTTKRIGLLAGAEPQLTAALIERLSGSADLEVEPVALEALYDGMIRRYDAILDRTSGRVSSYRRYLRALALDGCAVVNDPFSPAHDDAFFALSVARHLGLAVPRAVLLPQQQYPEDLPEGTLAHLPFPMPWQSYLDYVGTPAALRPVRPGTGDGEAVHDLQGLWDAYERVGREGAILLRPPSSVRRVTCVCVAEHVAVLAPGELAAVPALTQAAQALRQALGLDLCATTFAVGPQGDVVLEAADPTPRLDPAELGEERFGDFVLRIADLLVRRARGAGGLLRDRYPFGDALRASR